MSGYNLRKRKSESTKSEEDLNEPKSKKLNNSLSDEYADVMHKNKSFHPEALIWDHFDEIINQIDIETETLLANESLTQEERSILNDTRQILIEKINETKSRSMTKVNFNEEQYRAEWDHVLDDKQLTADQKCEIIKSKLILFDCFLMNDETFKLGFSLWITPCFYNPKSLEFLK